MNGSRTLALATLAMAALPWASAQAGGRISVGIGIGVPYYRPYYPYAYYRPYVVAPVPVYYAQPPVYYVPTYPYPYYQPVPAVYQAPPAPPAPANSAYPTPTPQPAPPSTPNYPPPPYE